ncbi:hypothetical protein D7147_11200 [Micromonospora musae]|uniref:DUF1579 domain-containing protein n=1 Tax=Micromonospora musae TaxID=1894970 RepID=A0A3A9YGS6_9ACTN|nr:hypothetical protein [Micromonospora musae]RKN21322.1 hypothetical protein D7147_11200 [Micromonospora musae]RKN36335.1 hypothetical protein D7044_01390 [Micromonospora musae]
MNDFDFLVGTWDIVNRRLTKRHVGSDEWDEFPSVKVARRFFDGAGSFDEITFPTKDFSGATVRTFNPASGEWSIYWMNSAKGVVETPPLVGRFVDGVGTFYADDVDEGRPIRCRFIWSEITATSARWEQAFSTDGGRTWETNWIMEFTRASLD